MLVIIFLALISSAVLYFVCKPFVDKLNFKYWVLLLISPCLLLYTNVPSKELIFFYPSIIYIILECKFLISKNKNLRLTLLNLFLKFSILPFLVYWRGYLAAPYVILALLSIFIKNFNIGKISMKLNTKKIIFSSFILSTLLISLVNIVDSEFFRITVRYLYFSFDLQNTSFRSGLDHIFMSNPINSFYIQYLALFPTLDELIAKPYQFIIVIESIILIYVFFKSWNILFKTVNNDKNAKKILLFLLTFIGISYFSIYGFVGSFNLGSSQRLRVNFIPLGIFFPLILEKKY